MSFKERLTTNPSAWALPLAAGLFLLAAIFELVVAFKTNTDLLSGSMTLALTGAFKTAIDDLINVANEVIDGAEGAAKDIANEGQSIGNTIAGWGSSIGLRSLEARDISLNFPSSRNFSFETTIGGVDQGSTSWFDAINPIFLLFDGMAHALKDTAVVTFVLCVVLFLWTGFIAVHAILTKTKTTTGSFFKAPSAIKTTARSSKAFTIGIILFVLATYLVSLIPFIIAGTFWLTSRLVSFTGDFFFVTLSASSAGSVEPSVLSGLASFFLFVTFVLAIYGYREQKRLAAQADAETVLEKGKPVEETEKPASVPAADA